MFFQILGCTDFESGEVSFNTVTDPVLEPVDDLIAPSAIVITSPAHQSTRTFRSFTLVGSCETGSQLSVTGDITPSSINSICDNSSFSLSLTLSPNNGSKNITIYQTDASNNRSLATIHNLLLDIPPTPPPVDSTAPDAVLITSPANQSTRTSLAFTLVGSCENSARVYFLGDISPSSSNALCSNSSFSVNLNLAQTNGSKNISIYQIDEANNRSASTVHNLILNIASTPPPADTTAPNAVVISSPANRTTVNSRAVTLTGTCESGSQIYFSGDVSSSNTMCSNSAFTKSLNLSSSNGSKNITIYQTDASDNRSVSVTHNLNLNIPTTPTSEVIGIDSTLSNCENYPHTLKRMVTNVNEFMNIPSLASPGTLFVLSAGTYRMSNVVLSNLVGNSAQRITICGQGQVKIEGDGVSSQKRIFTIKNSNFIRLANLEITLGMKGLMVEETDNSIFENLHIHNVGHEALHLMNFSSNNIVKNNRVYDAGKNRGSEGIGEGIYIGTAFGKDIEDKSDNNTIRLNQIGPGITADLIDIKEFTTGGLIEKNSFNGTGMTGANSGESWVNVKGNNYLIKDNVGTNSFKYGFKQIVRITGWGNFNKFENNQGTLNNNSADRLFIYLHRESTDAPDNIVDCDTNKILDAGPSFLTNSRACL